MATTYCEVGNDDMDAAAFIAAHPYELNLFNLPVKAWVAREDGNIVAVLMLRKPAHLDAIVADPDARPFMRLLKLYRIAEAWLKAAGVPIICVEINDTRRHFQSLMKRIGFEKIGANDNVFGVPVETVFAKTLIPGRLIASENVH